MINPDHHHHEQASGALLGLAIFTAPAAINLIRYGIAKAKAAHAKTANTGDNTKTQRKPQ